MVSRRRGRRRCSRSTGRCWGFSEELESPCRPSSGRTTPEELCPPEAIASSLRDDSRPSPLDGDGYCAGLPVADQDPVPRVIGDREGVLFVAADAAPPDAPPWGPRSW
jgi:hypothetical protein